MLDEAVAKLGAADREAVLLRFYQGLSVSELAAAIGTGEEAAKKRVQRAVERLRGVLAKKGVVAGVAALGVLMAEKVTEAAPAGLVEAATAAVGSGGAGSAGVIAKRAMKMMAWAKVKMAAIMVIVLALGAGGVVAVESERGTKPSVVMPAQIEPRSWTELARQYRTALDGVSTVMVDQRANGSRGRLVQVDRAGGVRLESGPTLEIAGTDGVLWRTNGKGWTRQGLTSGQAAILDGVVRWVGPVVDGEATLAREEAADEKVADIPCKAYRVQAWATPLLLVDRNGLIRKKVFATSGRNVVFNVQYNTPMGGKLFVPPPSAANAVDADAWFVQHYPLEKAMWQTTVGASVVALHSVDRDADGRIYLRMSSRLTEPARRDAPGMVVNGIMPGDHCLQCELMIMDIAEPNARLFRAGNSVGGWWWTGWLVYEPGIGTSVAKRVELQLQMASGSSSQWLESLGLPTKARVSVPVDVEGAKAAGTYSQMMDRWFSEMSEADGVSVGTWVAYSERKEGEKDTIEGRHVRDQTADGFAKAVKTILAIPTRFNGTKAGEGK